MKRLFGSILLFIAANAAIFFASLGRFSGDLGKVTSGYHMHLIAFFGLSFIMSLILIHEKVMLPEPFLLCFLYSTFIAIVIEIFQMGTSYRTFSYWDIAAGMAGAGIYSIMGGIAFKADLFHKYWYRN